MIIHAKTALTGEIWTRNLRLHCTDGRITSLEENVEAQAGDTCVEVLLPALTNLHSHTFQRAMAGMTEHRAAGRDSFWTWRETMYRFLQHLTPDQIEAIAAMAFVEMQEAGFAAAAEFHYVHHQPDGTPYTRLSELSDRIFAAAAETGIGLTHLPVLYTYGGVEGQMLQGGQLRFANGTERFLKLAADCRDSLAHLPSDARCGVAPHSLRAVPVQAIREAAEAFPDSPVHIHIAEQKKEVAEVEARFGQRPVAWLLDQAEVDSRWCLIHATHMIGKETEAMAASGAVAGLCPVTEANLGDGAFNGPDYLAHGGAFGVGTDSNVRISLGSELRMLEYSQRLRDMSRNALAPEGGSTGHAIYTGAARGGAQAAGRDAGVIAPGHLADLVAISRSNPALCALRDEQLLDGFCFAAPDSIVTDVWSAGRHMVRGGRHVSRERIATRYMRALSGLADVL